MKHTILALAAAAGLAQSAQAHAQVHITEWMYSGGSGEFIEFTNLGPAAVDFTGWSYDDESAIPGVFDLSGFGLVAFVVIAMIMGADPGAILSDIAGGGGTSTSMPAPPSSSSRTT